MEESAAYGRRVLSSSLSSPTLHKRLRKLDREIAKDLWRIKIEAILEPRMAKIRYERAKKSDAERREIRHILKDRKKPRG